MAGLKRSVSLFMLLALLGTVVPATGSAQAGTGTRPPTGTEEVAACMEKAGDAFAECIDGAGWIKKGACVVKLAADVILCLPRVVFKPL